MPWGRGSPGDATGMFGTADMLPAVCNGSDQVDPAGIWPADRGPCGTSAEPIPPMRPRLPGSG